MSINWERFNYEEGEAYGEAGAACPPGEFNVVIGAVSFPDSKPGVMLVTYEVTQPADFAGRVITERFTMDAVKAKTSMEAEEVSLKRLKGMLRKAKPKLGTPPPQWKGLTLAITVRNQKNDAQYTEVAGYMDVIGGAGPGGAKAASVPAGHTGADDEIPF